MAETLTVNYSWTKPEIGASIDNWGGFLNQDLDGIDSVVHGIQTTKYDASNPAGYIVDAPSDGTAYARKSAAWSHLTHNDITDWASAAAPPVKVQDTAPASPVAGSLWWDSVGGQLYCWVQDANSSQWVIAVNVAAALPPASTTILGGVKVDGTTIKAAGDGTISTTVVPMGDNRIINGDMRIDQRNNGAVVSVGGYSIDRWTLAMGVAGKYTAQRNPSAMMAVNGFPFALNLTSLSAYSSAAGDSFFAYQVIEADMVSDFAWGTAGAQPVTLSFWVNVSVAGTYSGAITNNPTPPTRSYPFSFAAIVGWQKVVITIPGDAAGTWVMSGNAAGVTLRLDLGSGSTFRGPAGAWASGNFNGATGGASVVATNGAVMQITGVKLEIGSVATPFNRQSLAKSLADCQRYYQSISQAGNAGYMAAGTSVSGGTMLFPVTMRATPSTGLGTPIYGNSSALAVGAINVDQIRLQSTVTAAGYYFAFASPLTLSAEL